MYSVNPTWRGPPVFSLIWHCCSSHVIQHCLSNRIPRRDIVFGILTRGFILLITEVDRSERIRWQECHPARRLHSAMTLGADDVKSNQNVGGSIIMLENIGSEWFSGQCYHFDRICWLEQQSNCTIISNNSIILYGMSVGHAIKTRKKLWV